MSLAAEAFETSQRGQQKATQSKTSDPDVSNRFSSLVPGSSSPQSSPKGDKALPVDPLKRPLLS